MRSDQAYLNADKKFNCSLESNAQNLKVNIIYEISIWRIPPPSSRKDIWVALNGV